MTYREAFDRFWSIYPKRLDRNDAMKALVAAIKSGARLDEILRGVETYQQEILRGTIEAKFVRKAHVWLAKGCWTDGLTSTI